MNDIPQKGRAFDQMMEEVDRQLIAEDIPVGWRAMKAIPILARRYNVSIPLGVFETMPRDIARHYWVGEEISAWFQRQYGNRTKVDPTIGRLSVLIDGDLWTMRIPQLMGSVRILVSGTLRGNGMEIRRGPIEYNVMDSIIDLTQLRLDRVSEEGLINSYRIFSIGLEAFSLIQYSFTKDILFEKTHADLRSSVDLMALQFPQYGASKWASLQAAEKILKACIRISGGDFTHSHILTRLAEEASAVGIVGDWASLFQEIQCSAKIRYGDEPCTREEAVAAQHACVKLVLELKRAGAPLVGGMSISSDNRA